MTQGDQTVTEVSEVATESDLQSVAPSQTPSAAGEEPAEPEGPPPRGKWNPPETVDEIPLKYQKNKKYF